MLHLKSSVQFILIFALASALAYGFGFQALFIHTALEALWWGLYYLGSLFVGLFVLNKLPNISL